MATARWFFESLPNSRFIVQEQLRQGYWRVGPATLWLDAVQATAPYKAVGAWGEIAVELEWVPRDFVILRTSRHEEELVRATSLQLGFKPLRTLEEGGRFVTEWRLHPAPAVAVDE